MSATFIYMCARALLSYFKNQPWNLYDSHVGPVNIIQIEWLIFKIGECEKDPSVKLTFFFKKVT
jgi:hypothetical protein